MANALMKIEVKITELSGNTKFGVPVVRSFKTKDDEGKCRFFNRGRAIRQLIDWMRENNLTTDLELIIRGFD